MISNSTSMANMIFVVTEISILVLIFIHSKKNINREMHKTMTQFLGKMIRARRTKNKEELDLTNDGQLDIINETEGELKCDSFESSSPDKVKKLSVQGLIFEM
jgi:hypothetical protein